MTADLDPDVRDRAAQAACLTFYGGEGAELLAPGPGWLAVVDAVVEVLAAEQCPPNDYSGGPVRSERELLLEAQVAELEEELEREQTRQTQAEAQRNAQLAAEVEVAHAYRAEWDTLKARVEELREDARRDSHDYELLRQHNEQLREALGMARKEYGGKNISELTEYDRLRLTANGFQAMNGVLELQVKRQRARVDLLTTALDAISHNDCEDYSDNGYDSCAVQRPDDPDGWCAACIARAVLSATPAEPVPLKASQIPTEPGVPSKRVSPGSRSYWAAIREAENTEGP